MTPIGIPALAIRTALACLLLLFYGCTRKTPSVSARGTRDSATRLNPGPHAKIGRPELAFDYQAVSELILSKANPIQSDSWSARLIRKENPSFPGTSAWFIESGPTGRRLTDRWANGPFILHLLDTIRTVQAQEVPFSGSAGSFGLSPPWYDLRWSLDSGQGAEERELALGAPARDADGEVQGLYGEIREPSNPQIYTMNGALLQMLEFLPDFNAIRLPRLATFDAGDVDQIEVIRRGKRIFYARRDQNQWLGARHRLLARDVDAWLQAVTHLRIQRFIDDSSEAIEALHHERSRSDGFIRFQGRHLKPVSLRFARDGAIDASISTRPDTTHGDKDLAVFELYPRASELISSLLR